MGSTGTYKNIYKFLYIDKIKERVREVFRKCKICKKYKLTSNIRKKIIIILNTITYLPRYQLTHVGRLF